MPYCPICDEPTDRDLPEDYCDHCGESIAIDLTTTTRVGDLLKRIFDAELVI